VLARAIEVRRPWAVLLPATSFGRDLAPRVAARLGIGLTGDCLGVEIDRDGHLQQMKPAFGGQVVAPIASRTLPNMATIRPGMLDQYTPDRRREARVEMLDTNEIREPRARVISYSVEGDEGLALDEARLVVCVGTGVGGPEGLAEVEGLARALCAWMGLSEESVAIGGTRKVVDNGWLPRQQQIGITGHAIAPDLYLGLGVQGKFNHMVGILGSDTIVSVNLDPGAPIFEMSDIGVVCDWREFTGALMRKLERY
jgi:electron transfer flavoprotein alpha subunit